MADPLTKTGRFLRKDGVKICTTDKKGALRFYDKDRRRSRERGDNCVKITPLELALVSSTRVETA